MKVLMFGWEFPPYASGGLGTACFGLTKGLCNHGIDITFVIPHAADSKADFVKLVSAGNIKNIKFKEIDSPLQAYMTSTEYKETLRDYIKYGKSDEKTNIYGRNLFEEVARYAASAGLIAKHEPHDIIHCHDWMTYQAGINARKISKKPLVVHVHATEFDRTGDHPNQVVYDMEYKGFHEADHIMAVSQFTKNKIVKHYNINPDKITVVHNAVEFNDNSFSEEEFKIKEHNKIVLFLGRITLQKGPEYFLYAAKKVLDIMPDVRF
ncbi:MAG: glycosyltransferase family 4 protein, partial [archaeon]